ncbi:DUF5655 domain-containing protein [Arthrobacter silvisoli]|uniref:DUF5655 domain-containing protein n=1 Tax=Arthrobacter silvisoli TaxID=2291022 RepID=UPI001FE5210E|nr:DUF5655 domain-containing protein [Arthrobacter silvisoli]
MHEEADDKSASGAAQKFFEGSPAGLAILGAVVSAMSGLGPAEVRVSKSQIAFRRRRGFAYLWRPGQYVKSDVPAVLSLALPRQLDSPRFKETVQPAPGVWMHHLELHHPSMVDPEVAGWLRDAYNAAS